jgi:hypothetical protein
MVYLCSSRRGCSKLEVLKSKRRLVKFQDLEQLLYSGDSRAKPLSGVNFQQSPWPAQRAEAEAESLRFSFWGARWIVARPIRGARGEPTTSASQPTLTPVVCLSKLSFWGARWIVARPIRGARGEPTTSASQPTLTPVVCLVLKSAQGANHWVRY